MSASSALAGVEPDEKTIDDHLAVQAIIRSYQVTNPALVPPSLPL